jgi:hypothetical protein
MGYRLRRPQIDRAIFSGEAGELLLEFFEPLVSDGWHIVGADRQSFCRTVNLTPSTTSRPSRWIAFLGIGGESLLPSVASMRCPHGFEISESLDVLSVTVSLAHQIASFA